MSSPSGSSEATLSVGNDTEISARMRGSYSKHPLSDRERVLAAANQGEDWRTTARLLDVKVKTAYHWVRQTRVQYKKRVHENMATRKER